MTSRRFDFITRATALSCCLALTACTGIMGLEPEPGAQEARLRAMHLAPDVPAVDVFVDESDDPAFAGLRFSDGTSYATLDAGSYRLDVALTNDPTPVLTVEEAALDGAGSYTALAYQTDEGPALLLLHDETYAAPSDAVRVRLVHAAAGVGAVDVYNMPRDGEPARIAADLALGEGADPRDLPSGSHVFGLDIDRDGAVDLRYELPDLSEGIYVNLYAAVDREGTPILVAQLPGGITARVEPTEGPRSTIPGLAGVRVLHGSPDAPNVDVFVGDSTDPVFADLPFTWGTELVELEPGAYRFRVSATGAGPEGAVIDAPGVTLEADRAYTVVAFDELASIRPLVVEEDLSELEPGLVRIRAAHIAAGLGQVDVYALENSGATSLLYADVDFGSAGAPLEVPAGDYTVGFDVDDDGLLDAFFDVPPFVPGTIASLYAMTDAAGDLFVLTQLRDGNTTRTDPSADPRGTGRVRVLHLSPDAPAVDVFLGGGASPVVADLAPGQGTELLELPAAPYDVAVSASGASLAEAVLRVDDLPIPEGSATTVVAYDTLDSISALALAEDLSPVSAGSIRVRAVHTASGVGDVDILNVSAHGVPPILVDDLGFGTDGGFVELPAGQYSLGLDLDDDRVPEAVFQLPHLAAGTIANLFAVADPTAVYLIAQLADGSTLRVDSTHP